MSVLDVAFNRQFRDQLADVGSFGFSVLREDFAGIDFDQLIQFRLNGQAEFQGIVEEIVHVALAQGEEGDQVVNVSGRGALALLDQAVIYPSRGVGAVPIEEVRSFSWLAPDFDSSAWPLAKQVNQQRDYAAGFGWGPLPWIWPDTAGFWIWADLPSVTATLAPTGWCLFRRSFTLAAAATVRIFSAFDDSGSLWVDGAEVTGNTSFGQGRVFEVVLGAGQHLLAANGGNAARLDATALNPAGFLCAVYTVGDGGLLDQLVVHTDATWQCLPYPVTQPGFTHGEVLIALLTEAQAQGALAGVTYDFTATLDSAGNPWGQYREITMRVGRTVLAAVLEMSDTFIDVAMAPGSLTLRAWDRGGRGTVRTGASGPPVASSPNVTHDGNTPDRAIDGSTGTWWQPVDTVDTITIQIDLSAPVALTSTRAQFYSTDFRFIDYTIETWNGSAWVTVATVVGNASADVTDTFGAVVTDRFRVVATTWIPHVSTYGPALLELTWTGTAVPVTLAQTDDPATSDLLSLTHTGKRTRMNAALIRYGGGWIEETDPASITTHGHRAAHLELGAVQGEAEARKVTVELMANRAQPSYATRARLAPSTPATTPYDGFGIGDTINCPDETDVAVPMRVRTIEMVEDGDGVIEWPVELRDQQHELEERHDVWLRRMADGALLGGARVSSPAGTPQPITQLVSALRVAEFSFDNSSLVASLSPRRPAEVSGNMVEIFAELTTAGTTSTTVQILLNDAVLGSALTLAAGVTEAEVALSIVPILANVDKLQAQIVTAGTGAEGLDIQVRAI